MSKHTPTAKSEPEMHVEDEMRDRVLSELSMDSRQSLASTAEKIGISKTAAFNILNEMVNSGDIRFVPELNVEELWKHELLHTTKWMQKREFRKLNIHEIGFSEYVCMVKFNGKKPSEETIANAAKKSYMPQNISMLYGKYDLFMYVIARNAAEVSFFVNSFSKSLDGYKMEISIRNIRKTYGFFPVRDAFISELKLPEKYKKLLLILNENSRCHLSQMAGDIDKNTITYMYKALLDYGIIRRSTVVMKKPENSIIGLITYRIVDQNLFNRNKAKWLNHLVNTNTGKNAAYLFMADTYEPYGGIVLVTAKNSSAIESVRDSLASMRIGIEIESQILTKSILGELGFRNFDVRQSHQYGVLQTDGLVPRSERISENARTRY